MKSMTGFGRKDYRDEALEISIEIKTINHRFRDFFLKLPRSLNPIEENIRKAISEKIARGRIEIFIKYNELDAQNKRIVFNRDLAKAYIHVLNEIKTLDSMIDDDLSPGLIAKFPDVVSLEDESVDYDEVWCKMAPVLEEALEQVDTSRSREGEALKRDVAARCAVIEEAVSAIEAKSPEMLKKYQEELRTKVEAYTDSSMADKLDISEELTRLKSHTGRLKEILGEEDEPVGRKLDFLVQELNREINTIGSKSNDIGIANLVVDVKSEIEKIREQIQNIE